MVTAFNNILMGSQLCHVDQIKWHSRNFLCLHHQGSDVTSYPTIVDYQSVPGKGSW